MLEFPSSARVACWLNAWIAGLESADEVIAGVIGEQVQVEFVLPVERRAFPPALVLGELRRLGVHRVSVCLPSPGHLLGLGGPAEFNADALETGEAVIWHGAQLGFVPVQVGAATSWTGTAANPPTYLSDVASADRDLRAALGDASHTLAQLDVAGWNPDVADALLNLRSPEGPGPRLPFASAEAARTATTGLRCVRIVDLAEMDDGGALSSREATWRREALAPLCTAARAAVMAACSSVDGR